MYLFTCNCLVMNARCGYILLIIQITPKMTVQNFGPTAIDASLHSTRIITVHSLTRIISVECLFVGLGSGLINNLFDIFPVILSFVFKKCLYSHNQLPFSYYLARKNLQVKYFRVALKRTLLVGK